MLQSDRAHNDQIVGRVVTILLLITALLLFLYISFNNVDSYYQLEDNGEIYLVSTKNWGHKETSKTEVRYNDELSYWEVDLGGEWFSYDAWTSGDDFMYGYDAP